MDTTIVYIDEAAYALDLLAPLLLSGRGGVPRRWVVVGCAPRITQRVSKWVTHSARESWRGKWADKVFDQVVPLLQAAGDSVITQVARGPLAELNDALLTQHGGARVLDARRPRPGPDAQAARPDAPRGLWSYAAAVAGSGLLLAAD